MAVRPSWKGPFRRLRQQRARRAGSRIDAVEQRGRSAQWFLLAGHCERAGLTAPRPADLHPIYPPDDVFWADPFCWSMDGQFVVFFEEFPFETRRGHISAIALGPDGRPVGEPSRVLEEPYHLSYPFLLELGGDLYMIPEKAGTRRVDLYRCVEFPRRWVLAKTLVAGLALHDPTLFEHDGRWWLFCAAPSGRVRVNECLAGFYASEPLSDRWTAHPRNPLVRDFSRGRPAGRVLRLDDGTLVRPSQDCVRRYGHGLNLNAIDCLSPLRYEERPIWHMSGEEAGGWRALHHLDWHRGMLVMDAQRLIPAPATGP